MRSLLLRGLLLGTILAPVAVSAHQRHKHAKPQQPQKEAPIVREEPLAREAHSEWRVLRSHLGQPEYWHTILNPIPIYGSGLAALLLLLSYWKPGLGTRQTGLGLTVAVGLITIPTLQVGERAYDRLYETIPLEAQAWLDVHMDRAENFQYVFYLAAALALAALLLEKRRPQLAARLTGGTLASIGLGALLAGWIAHAGGQVGHDEFRLGPPPASAMRKAPPEPSPQREAQP
jgi:hypothetical protein